MRSRHSIVTLIAALFLTAGTTAGGRQQTPAAAGTGLLMGVIVDALSDQPAASAQVTLGGAAAAVNNTQVLTDGEGRFVFLDLPRGTYTITATKAGYADGAYGRRRPGGLAQVLSLADAERLGSLKIPIWKHAAITGTIRDEAGEPTVQLPVQVLLPAFVAGRLKLTLGPVARTDDRGVYRIGSLAPGEYIVVVPSTQTTAPLSVVDLYEQGRGSAAGLDSAGSADVRRDLSFSGATDALNLLTRPGATKVGSLAVLSASGNMRAGVSPPRSSDGRLFVYPTQYFPTGFTAAQATTLTLESGEERAGVDIQLRLQGTSRVSGTVTGPAGPLIAAMTLTPDAGEPSTMAGLETATSLSDASGRFTFIGVPPGPYQLRAMRVEVPPNIGSSRGAPPPRPTVTNAPAPAALAGYTLSATQSIAVGVADIDGVAVLMRPGFRVSGRAEFPNTATPPDPDAVRRMSATFDPADARPLVSPTIARGQFTENGDLSSYQLPAGRYYLRINNPPPGWTLKSAQWNGQDISNIPFELNRDVGGLVVTFTDRPSTISGQVRNELGTADTSATVLIFPADPASWSDYGGFPRRLRAVRVGRDGRYTAMGLPAGKYVIAAIPEEASDNWQNPKMLQALAGLATPITLADGGSHQQELKTLMVPRR